MLTPEQFTEKEQAYRVRLLGGKTIANPVTKEESELMDRLREHFARLSMRPHPNRFCAEVLPEILFTDAGLFDRLTSAAAGEWLRQVWLAAGEDVPPEHRLPSDGLDTATVSLSGNRRAAVIRMPKTVSLHETTALVVCQRRKRFGLFAGPYPLRFFWIVETITTPDWRTLAVDECILTRQGLATKRHGLRQQTAASPEALAALVDAIA